MTEVPFLELEMVCGAFWDFAVPPKVLMKLDQWKPQQAWSQAELRLHGPYVNFAQKAPIPV